MGFPSGGRPSFGNAAGPRIMGQPKDPNMGSNRRPAADPAAGHRRNALGGQNAVLGGLKKAIGAYRNSR